jgi:peptide/nickel transport system permease protein
MRLSRYILRRLLLVIPVLLGVSIFIFALTRLTGDPVSAYVNEKMTSAQIEQVREQYHLNDPLPQQFLYWLEGIVQGDWGWSRTAAMPVTDAIQYYFPATFELAVVAILIGVVVGIFLGTRSAIKKNKPFDHATRIISLIGVSIPVFWLGLLLLQIFYGELNMFPIKGRVSESYIISGTMPNGPSGFYLIDSLAAGNLVLFGDVLWHLVLPAVTLAFGSIAVILRMQRNSMLEVLSLDYIKTARAKGLDESTVINKHARRNAMIPTTTVVGLSFGSLLGGAVLTESIFSWPGLGRWSASSITRMDSASILGFCLLVAFIYVMVNLIVDVLYAYLDPRVRLG